jgi:hypothetical protein
MNTRADEVRRAYAVLGLRPGAPAGQVRRRYKALARQWHPDRHSGEARNEAEAASRMKAINAACRCLADHLGSQGRRPAADAVCLQGSPREAAPGGTLSHQELDRLVQAIGSDGPIDWLLDGLGSLGGALLGLIVKLFVAAGIARVAVLAWQGGAAAVSEDRTLLLSMALLALLLLRERTARSGGRLLG